MDEVFGRSNVGRPGGWRSVTNFGTDPVPLPRGTVILASARLDGSQLPHDTTAWLLLPQESPPPAHSLNYAGTPAERHYRDRPRRRLELENERLQAELLAQLDELRAPRARIGQTTRAERYRLEQNPWGAPASGRHALSEWGSAGAASGPSGLAPWRITRAYGG